MNEYIVTQDWIKGDEVGKPIVRCRNCEYRYDNQCGRYPDWFDIELDGFCAWGERKD